MEGQFDFLKRGKASKLVRRATTQPLAQKIVQSGKIW